MTLRPSRKKESIPLETMKKQSGTGLPLLRQQKLEVKETRLSQFLETQIAEIELYK